MKYIIGIDPGFSGAICVITFDENKSFDTPSLTDIWDTPLRSEDGNVLTSEGGGRQEIDARKVGEMVGRYSKGSVIAFVERVASSPQMGVVSSFRFGQGYGVIQGVLAAKGIPTQLISPQVWKSHFELSSNKKKSLELIRTLYPRQRHLFKLEKHDGRAEACLIAHFGWQKFFRGKDHEKPTVTDMVAELPKKHVAGFDELI